MSEPIPVNLGLAGLRRAVEIAHGQAALAKRLDEIGQQQDPPMRCKQQNVWAWLNRDMKVPAEWARLVAEAVDFDVVPAEIRPDLYPHPEDGLPESRRALVALDGMSELLKPQEAAAVRAAVAHGPESAANAIATIEPVLEERLDLLRDAESRS